MIQASFELDIGDAPRARWSDPSTSHMAAASAKQLQADHQCLILGALRRGPAGCDRISSITRLTSYQVSKRLSELQRSGAIKLTGKNVQSTAGRAQREWSIA